MSIQQRYLAADLFILKPPFILKEGQKTNSHPRATSSHDPEVNVTLTINLILANETLSLLYTLQGAS